MLHYYGFGFRVLASSLRTKLQNKVGILHPNWKEKIHHYANGSNQRPPCFCGLGSKIQKGMGHQSKIPQVERLLFPSYSGRHHHKCTRQQHFDLIFQVHIGSTPTLQMYSKIEEVQIPARGGGICGIGHPPLR